jgi:hypothetical protein
MITLHQKAIDLDEAVRIVRILEDFGFLGRGVLDGVRIACTKLDLEALS